MDETTRGRQWKNEPVVLFVEGYSDLCFYAELLEHCGLKEGDYFIQNLGGNGRTQLLKQARLLLKPDNLERIRHVIVAYDSDGNVQAAFASSRDSLKQAVGVDVQIPFQFVSHGRTDFTVLIAGGDNGQQPEEIETLALAAWAGKSGHAAVQSCVGDYLACLVGKGVSLHSPDKVKLGAMLAVLHEEDPRLGPAARANHFDFDTPGLRPWTELFRGIAICLALGGPQP